MKQKNHALASGRKVIGKGAITGILSAVLLATFALLLWNAVNLNQALNDSTKEYLKDVTVEMAEDIQETMSNRMTKLELVAESILHKENQWSQASMEAYLNQKAKLLEFDSLLLLDRSHILFAVGESEEGGLEAEKLLGIDAIQSAFQGQTTVDYVGGAYVFYAVPVLQDTGISHILVGIRDIANMQKMIMEKKFSGESKTCIINSSGKEVISPVDLGAFLQLDELYADKNNLDFQNAVKKMTEDWKNGRDGMVEFSDKLGNLYFLAYDALHIHDWFLLTIIPGDLISRSSSLYVMRSFLITGIMLLIFVILIFVVQKSYRDYERGLKKLAFRDSVTGGMNLAAFQLTYGKMAEHMKPGTYWIALLNVKGFKLINENYGKDTGNELLCYVYEKIHGRLRPELEESVARMESDYFFFFLKEEKEEGVRARLKEILSDIAFDHRELPVNRLVFRQGACLVEKPGQDLIHLMDHVRAACQYEQGNAEENCVFYNEELIRRLKREQELNEIFEDSLQNHDFQIYLQPKVGTNNYQLMGAEALSRWNHPEKGFIYPSDYIPLFEKNGKICQLDQYVFQQVCELLERWKREGRELIPVSVNLSRKYFEDPNFLTRFLEISREYDFPKEMIEFELTESIFFARGQIDIVKECIHQMHAYGFQCSMDDFGSGFSSLGLLKEFDVDALKLDRCFFLDISSPKAQNVIECILDLARKLHLRTVAEGIETREQLEYLQQVSCDMIQGYIYSKPLPVAEFEKWAQDFGW